jgi:23S rRNA (uracil1939-C5)-methyltransferase
MPPHHLTIESIAGGGDGVARDDGMVVFVPRTAPGDVVEAEVTVKGRMGRGRVTSILTPGPGRTAPACPHYDGDRCGGCQLQHLTLDAQRAAKQGIIRDAMRRIGKREVPLPEIRGGARAWRYRRKLTLALRWRGERWTAGLHQVENPERVFDLQDCRIADERLLVIWRAILAAGRHLPRVPELRGAVRLLDDRASFVLEGGKAWRDVETFAASVPSLAAIWWIPEEGKRRLMHDARTAAEPAASFVQVNPEMADALHAFTVERVMAHAPLRVVDAYAGAGDMAQMLAARGVHVTAIELDEDATAFSAARLPAGSRAISARVEDAIGAALPADVVILNPPRAGVDARVTRQLAATVDAPRAIIYVSCDPATLARDIARLPGWRIASLTAFDMFPQTAHVETVCELVRESAA